MTFLISYCRLGMGELRGEESRRWIDSTLPLKAKAKHRQALRGRRGCLCYATALKMVVGDIAFACEVTAAVRVERKCLVWRPALKATAKPD